MRSQTTWRLWPPPAAQPLTTATTTLGIVRMRRCTSRMCSRPPSALTRRSSTVSAVSPCGVLVAGAATDALVAARAERPLAGLPVPSGPGPLPVRSTTPDVGGAARVVEHAVELVDGVRAEGVHHLGPVERHAHAADADGPVVGHVGEVLEPGHLLPGGRVERLADTGDRAHGGKASRRHPERSPVDNTGTAYGARMPVPPLGDLLASLRVVAIPMRVPFRGVTTREVALSRARGVGGVRAVPRVRPARGVAVARRRRRDGVGRVAGCRARRRARQRHRPGGAGRGGGRGAGPVPGLHDGQGQGGRARTGARRRRRPGGRRPRRPGARRARVRVDANGAWSVDAARDGAGRPGAATTSSTPSSPAPRSRSCATCGSRWRATGSTCRSPPTSRSARPRTPCASVTSRRLTSSSSRSRRSAGCGPRCASSRSAGCPRSSRRRSTPASASPPASRWRRRCPGSDHACGLGTVALLDGDVTRRARSCPTDGALAPGRVAVDPDLLDRWAAPPRPRRAGGPTGSPRATHLLRADAR